MDGHDGTYEVWLQSKRRRVFTLILRYTVEEILVLCRSKRSVALSETCSAHFEIQGVAVKVMGLNPFPRDDETAFLDRLDCIILHCEKIFSAARVAIFLARVLLT